MTPFGEAIADAIFRAGEIALLPCRALKTPYDDLETAEAALRGIQRNGQTRELPRSTYRCRQCGCWHLTKKEEGRDGH